MSKQIVFEIKDKEYVLEYNRSALELMEEAKITINMIDTMPLKLFKEMFRFSFLKNHSGLSTKKIYEIYEDIGDKQKLHDTLLKMWVEQMEILQGTSESEGKNEGNLIEWEIR